jgi:hypothetical protein
MSTSFEMPSDSAVPTIQSSTEEELSEDQSCEAHDEEFLSDALQMLGVIVALLIVACLTATTL